jgi:hypothetical protein
LTACNGSPNQRPERQARATTTSSSSSTSSTVAPTTSSSLVLARPCRGEDLGFSNVTGGGAGGTTFTRINLVNLSSSPCSLSGYPTRITGDTESGAPLVPEFANTFSKPKPGNLDAGYSSGELVIETSSVCTDGQGNPPQLLYRNIEVTVPGGGSFSLGDLVIDGTCQFHVSPLGLQENQ